ncbi:MAG: velvet factor-domain-containing protein [Benjaminiella poitrasii]|nr:MAG: velvet factor-domain-containing protein [Benjaminiella poitrasii]
MNNQTLFVDTLMYSNTADQNIYTLTIRQQPKKARQCSFKDKVDRRPIDPPPIVQLHETGSISFNDYRNSSNFFLHATLADAMNNNDIHYFNGLQTTTGSVAQTLYKLRDLDNIEGAFFVFADISIRIEGVFKLKFTLYKINDSNDVVKICQAFSSPFQVFSPKTFPGMSGSTELTRLFSEQGMRIRTRKILRKKNDSPTNRATMNPQRTNLQFILNTNHQDLSTSSAFSHDNSHVMSMEHILSSSNSSISISRKSDISNTATIQTS